ncbi:MAG: hypothetical protein Q9169_000411 [Polycauliona sp. 2 TL-2023]
MAFPPNDFDVQINNSTINQVITNPRLDPAIPPAAATSVAEQMANRPQRPFRDPKLAELGMSLQHGLDSHSTDGLTQSISPLLDAIKARSHHPALGFRLAHLLDTFTTDPSDKKTLPADKALLLYPRHIASIKSGHRQAMEEIDRLRHDRGHFLTFTHHPLEMFAKQQMQELDRALHEVQRLTKINHDLRATISRLSIQRSDAAPRIPSNEEFIRRYSAMSNRPLAANLPNSPTSWPPPMMQQPGQNTQYHGNVPTDHTLMPFQQQGLVTPPTDIGSSPLMDLATPSHHKWPMHQHPDRSSPFPPSRALGQEVPFNTPQRTPGVSSDLSHSATNNGVNHGEATSGPPPIQQALTAEAVDATLNLPSSIGNRDAAGHQTDLPAATNNPLPANHPGVTPSRTSQIQPRPSLDLQQRGQNPTAEPPTTNASVVEQQARQKRSQEWLSNGADSLEVQSPWKRAKRDTTTPKKSPVVKNTAPKKSAAKKTAPPKKTTEPRRKAPGKTKKDKELEAQMWTPSMIDQQNSLFKEAGERAAAAEGLKVVEPITVPDDVDEEEEDAEDDGLGDLDDEFTKQGGWAD